MFYNFTCFTSVYIYFIGCCTYVIYVTYMTRLAIIPYRREKYIFEGTEYHCGPYYENDTIESEIKKLINKSVVTENLFLVLQNYVLQILALYTFVMVYSFTSTVNDLTTKKVKADVEENQSSVNILNNKIFRIQTRVELLSNQIN